MATLDAPSPGLYASVLHALRSADPRETTSVEAVAPLISEFAPDEAALFPAALAGVLPLLRNDVARSRLAAEIASTFDLWEIAAELGRFAVEQRDPEIVLAAAGLCGTAGVNGSVADGLLGVLSPLHARAADIRLRPEAQPRTSDENRLYLQRWPGSRNVGDDAPLAPVVVLDSQLDASTALKLALEFVRSGASVRRLPPAIVPNWFGPDTVVVCGAEARRRIFGSTPTFPLTHFVEGPTLRNDQDLAVLLRRVNGLLPPSRRLRLAVLRTELATSVWDPDVYRLGVYETREAGFLAASPTAAMYRLARNGLLTPRKYGVLVWAFSDLVAVRTWQFLKSQSTRGISPKIVPTLASFSGDADVVRIGATSDGRVLADRGSGWEDVVTGAQVMDLPVEDVDRAFRPFSLGGRRAPDLLAASVNTRLHPAVLHGAPHRQGHRITAAALASMERRNGLGGVIAAYPELEGVDILDTIEVGRQLISV